MNALVLSTLALLQPKDADAAAAAAGMLAGCMGIYLLLVLAALAFGIFCFWRIFTKAGYNGAFSLLMLIPGVGGIIVVCILAFGEWPALKDK